MNNFSDNSPDGLVEGVGQELQPCGPPPSGASPIQPKGGEWAFRFNYGDPARVFVHVDAVFSSPFPMTAQLCSEMNETEVENLKTWLCRILDVMNGKPVVERFSPVEGRAGEKVTIIGKNFLHAREISFGPSHPVKTFEIRSDTHIVAFVPPDAETGPISIRNPRGVGTSSEIFTVR